MAMNGAGNPGNTVMVLYKVVNSESDAKDPTFNAFPMSREGRGPTLATVKQNCAALHGLNQLGPEGYHWRVCVEDKPTSSDGADKKPSFSWWDIQDENAVLPVKEASPSQLRKFFAPPKAGKSGGDGESAESSAAKEAQRAFKTFGKVVTNVVAGTDQDDSGPPVTVIAFKLLDLVKMHDEFNVKHGHGHGHHGQRPSFTARPSFLAAPPPPPPPSQRRQQEPQQHSAYRAPRPTPAAPPSAPRSVPQQQQQQPVRGASQSQSRGPTPPVQQQQQQQARARHPAQQQQEASLMDFGDDSPAVNRKVLHHSSSSSANFDDPSRKNETRAERLKREYAKKQQTSHRVWDDVDQRWVEIDPAAAAAAGSGATRSTASAPPGAAASEAAAAASGAKKNVKGIRLDPANAAGKSAGVQAAVHKRVQDMRDSQAKALQEVREREAKKKSEEAEEDAVRRQLEPRIKAWSEEHGKKKQLRALLASLHTILWPEANWKQVSLGDILDDSKVKRCFHKASRVVHPDKTHHLDAEKRFLAKRIFDALSQAKTNFDNGAK